MLVMIILFIIYNILMIKIQYTKFFDFLYITQVQNTSFLILLCISTYANMIKFLTHYLNDHENGRF